MLRPIIASTFLIGSLLAGPDWPQFRGPDGDGHSPAKNVPVQWSDTENVAWVVPVAGRGWSSPSLKDGRIYLTTAVVTDGKPEEDNQADRSLRALCLDAATGKTLWDTEVFKQDGATAPTSIHKKNGHASPTALVTDDRVFVHFGHQGTAALDHSGKIVWTNRELKYPPQHGNGGSPILVDGKLIFNCDGQRDPFIAALDAATGKIAWRLPRPETEQKQKFAFATCSAFNIDGKTQVISPGAGAVDSFDPATGKHLWRVRYEGYSIVPKPILADGLIYISTAYDTPDMYCIDPHGASGDVTETHVKWTNGKRAPMTVAPIVVNGDVYWVTDQSGQVTCADAKTGEVYWCERVGSRYNSAAPLYADGRLYIQDEEGKCVVLKPGHTFEKIATNDVKEHGLASFAVTDGALFIRTDTKLFRIGK